MSEQSYDYPYLKVKKRARGGRFPFFKNNNLVSLSGQF